VQRRSVRGDDRGGIADGVELRKHLLFDGEILDDRLEHQIAAAEAVQLGDREQAREGGDAVTVVELPLLDLLEQRLLERRDRVVGRRLGAAPEHDVDAGLRDDLGDPAPMIRRRPDPLARP